MYFLYFLKITFYTAVRINQKFEYCATLEFFCTLYLGFGKIIMICVSSLLSTHLSYYFLHSPIYSKPRAFKKSKDSNWIP